MKDELRKKYLLLRKGVINKKELDEMIFKKIIHNQHIQNAQIVLCYVSTEDEVDTIPLITYLLKTKLVAVPKIENNTMNFYIIKSIEELKKGSFNILEPVTNNILTNFQNSVSITPGICFDKMGYRVGYGKGFYDKFYFAHPNIYKIGITYKECLIKKIKKDKFDVKVDEIITE